MAAYQQLPDPTKAEKAIRLAAALPQMPPIPEEARKHFIRGVEFFKAAKSPAEMKQVVNELGMAVRLAPWWPEARYDWALSMDAAGDTNSAIVNLKLYLLFKISDQDARDARDRIYALEARQERAAAQSHSAAPDTRKRP